MTILAPLMNVKSTQPLWSDSAKFYFGCLVRVRAPFDVRAAISGSLGAKIVFFGAASNIALTSPSSWKEFNISKVASDDGLSIEL